MSFDLAGFEVGVAPGEPAAFVEWYESVMDEDEESSRAQVGSALSAWVDGLQGVFPDVDEDGGDAGSADYSSVFADLAYVAFAWSDAVRAREVALSCAQEAGVGVFLLSDDGPSVWFPDGGGGMRLAFTF